jgi:hypothetical protein
MTVASMLTSARGWWNTWHTLAVLLGIGWIIWAAIIIGNTAHPAATTTLPRALNAIMLTGLSCGAVMAYIAGSNKVRRDREIVWQTAVIAQVEQLRTDTHDAIRSEICTQITEPLTEIAALAGKVKDRLGMRPDDDPLGPSLESDATVPLPHGRAYVTPIVADGRIQSLAEGQQRLAGTVAEIGGKLAELCLLAEQQQGVRTSRRRRGRDSSAPRANGRPPADKLDREFRAYLSGVYDKERNHGPQ